MTFYTFDMILGGTTAAFAILAIFLHLVNHATHLSVPREQLKCAHFYLICCPIYRFRFILLTCLAFSRIMRAALLVPSYSIFCFLCICFPKATVYLLPWLDVFQASCLASYFLLLCEYVSPHDHARDLFFSTIELKDKRARKQGMDGATWFRVSVLFAFASFSYIRHLLTISRLIATLDLHLSICPHFVSRRNHNRCDRSSRCLLPVQNHAGLRQIMGEHALHFSIY